MYTMLGVTQADLTSWFLSRKRMHPTFVE